MSDMMIDLFFLNPSDNFYNRIKDFLIKDGFIFDRAKDNSLRYIKDEGIVDVCLAEDQRGKYIIVIIWDIAPEKIRTLLSVCPECESNNIKPILYRSWKNADIEKLFDDGKLDFGPASYERPGTRPPTKACMDCGCMWHNKADIRYWSDIIKSGSEITKEDLGIL